MKRVLFITGTRADYGKLRSLMEQVDRDPAFECHIFVTGMHTLARYGSTYDEIKKRGFANVFLYLNQTVESSAAMDIVLANTIQGLAHYIREFSTDLIVVHGDRIEAMAGALVGAINNVLVAHVEGGELSGTVDELIRHAVTKLSHVHFVANLEARNRLVQMGEVEDTVFVVGSADVDVMLSDDLPNLDDALARYEIPFSDYALFMYHPVTTELEALPDRVDEVVAALRACGWNFVVIYPNNDRGSETILRRLRMLERLPRFRVIPSVRFEYFLTLLRHGRAIVGNSSAGIREAPVYGVPTINIGSRQLNRSNHPSIVHVDESRDEILTAMKGLPLKVTPSMCFGDGDCAQQFMVALRGRKFWKTPRQKQFRDLPATALANHVLVGAASRPTDSVLRG